MLHLTIPWPPAVKKNSKKVGRISRGKRRGQVAVFSSDSYQRWEKNAIEYVKASVARHRLLRTPDVYRLPYKTRVHITASIFVGDERRRDLTNLLEGPLDVLVKAGVIIDDNWKIVNNLDGSRVYLDRDNPRVELLIREDRSDEEVAGEAVGEGPAIG